MKKRIEQYDRLSKGKRYNEAYRKVLDARCGKNSLIEEDGKISERSFEIIEYGLIEFDMARFGKMDSKFRERLKNKLLKNDMKKTLIKFRNLRIDSQDWHDYQADIKELYDTLSEGGIEGLSADGNRFDVGATKIINFLFPELFVMVDKNVAKTLTKLKLIRIPRKGSTYDFSFKSYWQVMEICYQELEEYKKRFGDTKSLLQLDKKPTTLTRIFDKCAFIARASFIEKGRKK